MKKILFFSFALHLLIIADLCSQSGWVWQNPLPQGNDLYGLKMFNAYTGICFNSDNILRTENGGLDWSIIYTGFPSSNRSVSMVDNNTGYMLVDSVTLIKTINGGISWNFVYSGTNIKNSTLYFYSNSTGFAFRKINNALYSTTILKTTNGGTDWITVYEDSTFLINSIQFVNQLTGFAAGSQYIGYDHTKLIKTTNGGISWDSLQVSFLFNYPKVHFLNENRGYLFGNLPNYNSKVYETTNGGINWALLNYNWGQNVKQIQFLDQQNGFLLAYYKIFKTTDSGVNWKPFPIDYGPIIQFSTIDEINFLDMNTGYAIGSGGKIIKTTNSGLNWELRTRGYNLDWYLWDVSFSDNNTGFTISDYGKMLRTTNGGNDWTLLQFDSGLDFSAIAKVNSSVWYMATWACGKILKTTNTGMSWDTTYTNAYGPTRLEFINEQTGFGVCKYYSFLKTTNGGQNWNVTTPFNAQNWSLDFIDENTGFAGGSQTYKTTNGGTSWDTVSFDNDYYSADIQFVNSNTGFIASSGYINYNYVGIVLKTTNCGINWSATEVGDSYLVDIYFINDRIGFAMNEFALFKTIDGGSNWFELRTCTSNPMMVTTFTDSLTGWIVGSKGTIIKTTDGGGTPIGINPGQNEIPVNFSLSQNYPNPFNPATIISYSLPKNTQVTIRVYDLLGRLVKQLINENQSPGNYTVTFEGQNFASGVYFYSIETPEFTQSKKMVLLK